MPNVRRLSCEEALQRLHEYLIHGLPASDATEVERHLEACRACFSRAAFEKQLKERLAATGREPAPETLQKRIRELLRCF